jgi:putative membrane protein
MKTSPRILRRAEFNPKVCSYWTFSITLVFVLTIIGLPLLLLWLPLSRFFTRRYLERISCELTERHLKVSKGWLVRTEKTIPLSKITDLGMVQGPLMRYFGLHALSVETAGQSAGPGGALVTLTGIVDAAEFREAVLSQRDRYERLENESSDGATPAAGSPPIANGEPGGGAAQTALLEEIRDSLRRIEEHLAHSPGDRTN